MRFEVFLFGWELWTGASWLAGGRSERVWREVWFSVPRSLSQPFGGGIELDSVFGDWYCCVYGRYLLVLFLAWGTTLSFPGCGSATKQGPLTPEYAKYADHQLTAPVRTVSLINKINRQTNKQNDISNQQSTKYKKKHKQINKADRICDPTQPRFRSRSSIPTRFWSFGTVSNLFWGRGVDNKGSDSCGFDRGRAPQPGPGAAEPRQGQKQTRLIKCSYWMDWAELRIYFRNDGVFLRGWLLCCDSVSVWGYFYSGCCHGWWGGDG